MVIVIRQARVVRGMKGKLYLTQGKLVTTFRNDHNFGFDITNPDNWKKFLQRYRNPKTGKYLPRYSKHGDPIAYYVYVFGVNTWLNDILSKGSGFHNNYYALFPRRTKYYDENGDVNFLIPKVGRID